jgi:ABC-type dipeptide/oligopeptide/nickel transport system ATPase component
MKVQLLTLAIMAVIGSVFPISAKYKALVVPLQLGGIAASITLSKKTLVNGSDFEQQQLALEQEYNQKLDDIQIQYQLLADEKEQFTKEQREILDDVEKKQKEGYAWLEVEKSEWQLKTEKIETELQERIKYHEEQLQLAIEENEKIISESYQELESAREKYQEELEEYRNSIIKEYDEEKKAFLEEYAFQIQQLQEKYAVEIHARDVMISQLEAKLKTPKWAPKTIGMEEARITNELLNFLWFASERDPNNKADLICDFINRVESKNKNELVLDLAPRDTRNISKIIALSNELVIEAGYEECEIKPTSGALRFTLRNTDFEEYNSDLQTLMDQIDEPSADVIKNVFKNLIHAFVWGETGGGKSVLINNLIDFIDYTNKLEGADQVIRFFDPKFPHSTVDEDNVLHIDGIALPTWYKPESIYLAAYELIKVCDQRLDKHREEAIRIIIGEQKDRQLSKLDPITYILDELTVTIASQDELIGDKIIDSDPAYKGFKVSDCLKRAAQLGRSSKVRLIGVGQSPMPIDYDMKKIDFTNYTRIWLMGVAGTVLAGRGTEFLQLSATARKNLKNQLDLRTRVNDMRQKQGLNKIHFALIHAPGFNPFFWTLPAPHTLVGLLYPGTNHHYHGELRLPEDANIERTPYVQNLPNSVDLPSDPERDLIFNLNSMLEADPRENLNELQKRIYWYMRDHPEESLTLGRLVNRLRLNDFTDEEKISACKTLAQLNLISLLKSGKSIKLKFKS